MNFRFYIIFILIMFGFSCTNKDEMIKYQKDEVLNIENNIKNILSKLNYQKYEIIIIPHIIYEKPKKKNKKINLETFKGPNWIPEGPLGYEGNIPSKYKETSNQMTEYEKYGIQFEYDNKLQNEYYIDYISILIIFNELSKENIDKLKDIIKKMGLNNIRGDRLEIISNK